LDERLPVSTCGVAQQEADGQLPWKASAVKQVELLAGQRLVEAALLREPVVAEARMAASPISAATNWD
jgi:hypothetical protein